MPYCSIEEAWGTNFNTNDHKEKGGQHKHSNNSNNSNNSNVSDNLNNSNGNESDDNQINYKNIVPGDAHSYNPEYSDVDFESETLISNQSRSHKDNQKQKKRKKRKSFSRTMHRLPDTSGPQNRLASNSHNKVLTFSDNADEIIEPVKVITRQKDNNYKNLDTPISDYNKDLEQRLYDTDLDESPKHHRHSRPIARKKSKKRPQANKTNRSDRNNRNNRDSSDSSDSSDSDSSDSDNDGGQTSTNDDYYINNVKIQNNQLETYKDLDSEELEKQRSNKMRNNMLDIIVYVITGIFLIFILDLFVKLGKNAR